MSFWCCFDGDRYFIFVSAKYGVIETEKIAFLFSQLLDQRNEEHVTPVSTEICNLGMINNIKKKMVQL